jgi:8-oxo-dGTP diphosphatase
VTVGHFCVDCGAALEPRTVEGRRLEACPRCQFVLWRDPKVVTMVVVETLERQVVVGRRAIEPGYGRWCLPGGYVNHDEHPEQSAARECWEEICAQVEVTGLLGVYHIRKQDAASMVGIGYRARLREGQVPSPGTEMLEVRAFPADRLPELVFPSHRQAMADWLRDGAELGGSRR